MTELVQKDMTELVQKDMTELVQKDMTELVQKDMTESENKESENKESENKESENKESESKEPENEDLKELENYKKSVLEDINSNDSIMSICCETEDTDTHFILMKIGCIECGNSSGIVGVYTNKKLALAVMNECNLKYYWYGGGDNEYQIFSFNVNGDNLNKNFMEGFKPETRDHNRKNVLSRSERLKLPKEERKKYEPMYEHDTELFKLKQKFIEDIIEDIKK